MTRDARELWRAVEGLHAVVYFASEVADAVATAGVTGWWRGYFAGRAAPLGAVGPAVVTATFANFAPAMVERALPSAWGMAAPEQIAAARLAGMAAALDRLDHPDGAVSRAVAAIGDALDRAADAVDTLGRPLAAAWAAERRSVLDRSDPPVPAAVRAWLSATVVREHRGDAHVAALAAAGLDGCEAHVTLAGTGRVPGEELRGARGWTDGEWSAARGRLVERGLLGRDGLLTAAGIAVRDEVEAVTDRAGAVPWRAVEPAGQTAVVEALGPLGVVLAGRVPIRVPNPMGWEPLEG